MLQCAGCVHTCVRRREMYFRITRIIVSTNVLACSPWVVASLIFVLVTKGQGVILRIQYIHLHIYRRDTSLFTISYLKTQLAVTGFKLNRSVSQLVLFVMETMVRKPRNLKNRRLFTQVSEA